MENYFKLFSKNAKNDDESKEENVSSDEDNEGSDEGSEGDEERALAMKMFQNLFGQAMTSNTESAGNGGLDESDPSNMGQALGEMMGGLFQGMMSAFGNPEVLEKMMKEAQGAKHTESPTPSAKEQDVSKAECWKPSKQFEKLLAINSCYPLFSKKSSTVTQFLHEINADCWFLSELASSLVTDSVLYCLSLLAAESPCSPRKIVLSGNTHITDSGLYWLKQIIEKNKNLKEINLDGCSKITEKGIMLLAAVNDKLTITAAATAVDHFPDCLHHLKYQVALGGCSLVFNSAINTDTELKEMLYGFLPICQLTNCRTNLINLLTGKDSSAADVQLEHWTFRAVQFNDSLNPNFGSLVPSEVTQVVLSYDDQRDVKTILSELTDYMIPFLSKEMYVEDGRSTRRHFKWMAASNPGAAVVDYSTGIVRLVAGQRMTDPLSPLRPSFSIVLTQQPTAEEITIYIAVCMSDVHEIIKKKRKVKAGDRIELMLDAENAQVKCYHNGKNVDFPSVDASRKAYFPVVKVLGVPFVTYRIDNFDCIPRQATSDEALVYKKYIRSFTTKNVIFDETSCTVRYPSADKGVGVFESDDVVSAQQNEFSVKLLTGQVEGTFWPSISIRLSQGETWKITDKDEPKMNALVVSIKNGRMSASFATGTPINVDEVSVAVGDVITVKVHDSSLNEALAPSSTVQVTIYRNSNEFATVPFTFDSMMWPLPTFGLYFGNCPATVQLMNVAEPFISSLQQSCQFTSGKFLVPGRMHYTVLNGSIVRSDESVSEACIGGYIAGNSLSATNSYYEVQLTQLDERKLLGIGFAYKHYDLSAMPGWNKGSVAWHFDNGRMYLEATSGVDLPGSSTSVKQGDVIGCGFEPASALEAFNKNPAVHQNLTVYFTVNGSKVLEVPFAYHGGGLHPVVGMANKNVSVTFLNQCDPMQSENNRSAKSEMFADGGGVNFVLAACSDKTKPSFKLQAVREHFAEYSLMLEAKIAQLLDRHCEKASFVDHQQLASFCKLKYNVDLFISNFTRRCFQVVINKPADKLRLVETIVKVQNCIKTWRPYMFSFTAAQASVLNSIMSSSNKNKVDSVDSLYASCCCSDEVDRNMFQKLLRVLNNWGRILCLSNEDRNLVVTDVDWFVGLLQRIKNYSKEDPWDCGLTCLSRPSRVWRDRNLLKMAAKELSDQSMMFALLDVLVGNGILLRLKTVREQKGDVKACFVCPSRQLQPAYAPVSFIEGVETSSAVKFHSMKQTFTFTSRLPVQIKHLIMSACCRTHSPILLWCDGVVWYQGPVEVVLWTNSSETEERETALYIKATIAQPLISDSESGENLNSDQFKDAAIAVLIMLHDICCGIFIQHQLTFDFESDNNVVATRQKGSPFVSSSHTWELLPYQSSAYVEHSISSCTLCGNCSELGLSCDFSEIPSVNYLQCACKTMTTACLDCGMCRKCASKFKVLNSELRPCNYAAQQWADEANANVIISHRLLSPSVWNEFQLVCTQDISNRKHIPTINLLNYDAPPSKPVALLAAELPFSDECDYFEIEIIDTGEIGAIAVGAVPHKYPVGQQPGWTTGAIGYHADDGGIFRESGFAKIHLETCAVGDRMGCGVKIEGDQRLVYFKRNGQQIFETYWGTAARQLYPAIGMHSYGEAVRLLSTHPWRSASQGQGQAAPKVDLSKLTTFNAGAIKIKPSDVLKFPTAATRGIKQDASSTSTTTTESQTSIYLYSNSVSPVLFKIKAINAVCKPKRGVLLPDLSEPTEVNVVYDSGTSKKAAAEISEGRLSVQYIELTDDQQQVVSKDLKQTDFSAIWNGHKEAINSDYKVGFEWDTTATERETSSLSDPRYLPETKDGPPKLPAFCVEVRKNGELLSSVYVPRLRYRVALESELGSDLHSHVLIRCPKMPVEVCYNYFEGMWVEAEFDISACENAHSLLTHKLLQEPIASKSVFYAQSIIMKVCSDGHYLLGVPIDGQLANQSRWMRFMAVSEDIRPIGWCDKNFGSTSGLCTRLSTKEQIQITVSVFQENDTKAVVVKLGADLLKQYDRSYIFDKSAIDETAPKNIRHGVRCAYFSCLTTVQKTLLSRQAEKLKDWQTIPEKETSRVCVFLPRVLDHKSLYYPRCGELMNLKEMAVHHLCKDTHKVQLKHGGCVYEDVHFLNTAGTPADLQSSVGLVFNDLLSARAYAELTYSLMRLPHYDKLVHPELAKSINRRQVERCLHQMVEFYALTCLMLAESHGGSLADLSVLNNRATLLDKLLPRYGGSSDLIDGRCCAHRVCYKSSMRRFELTSFDPYHELVSSLDCSVVGMQTMPEDLPLLMKNVKYMELTDTDSLESLFADFYYLSQLQHFAIIGDNKLQKIADSIGDCENLNFLQISRSYISELPNSFSRNHSLKFIDVSCSLLNTIPTNFGNLSSLVYLDISSNPLTSLPESFSQLNSLKVLKISGARWLESPLLPGTMATRQENAVQIAKILSTCENKLKSLPETMMKCTRPGRTEVEVLADVNAQLFLNIPRLGLKSDGSDEDSCLPAAIFNLTSLEELDLSYQGMRSVPSSISKLVSLRSLNLSNCPLLESLPGAMGELPVLKTINVRSCPSLRTPPVEVVSRSSDAIMAYLKRLNVGFTSNRRTKLMIVGLGGAGKTSLLRALMSKENKTGEMSTKDVTDGIDICTWSVDYAGKEISYSAWDFAGQTVYYNTHQFFLSNRAVYLLLWTTRLGFEHAGLEFWLSSIKCHAPKSPIFVIGTHCDIIQKHEIPEQVLKQEYNQIKGFHFVSSTTGLGITELKHAILEATLKEKYMGEKVPKVYLDLEKEIIKQREAHSLLSWEAVCNYALEVGIYDENDTKRAVQFLHDLGTVQYFDTEFLRNHIVINPQWIVKVMSRVVSVKQSPIKDGRLKHSDLDIVWKDDVQHKDFPDLTKWLLRLTEEFDLTFPMPNQDINIVPCLLPQSKPQIEWLCNKPDGKKFSVMVYRFSYLPAGLFNRAQVRLFQFSHCGNIWKRGSILEKNGNQAVLHQISDKEMEVIVCGHQPENLLLVIHEVIETLIAESFHGVSYEYLIQCPDCLDRNEDHSEQSMFEVSLIQKAKRCGATFIQCRRWFHTVPILLLEAVMPPDDSSEYDIHLLKSMQALSDLRYSMSTDIFVSYCPDQSRGNHSISPKLIAQHLEQNCGYSCWFKENMNQSDMQDPSVVMALRSSKLMLVLMSTDYEKNDICRAFFEQANDVLKKPFVMIAVGRNFDWKATDFGSKITSQMYVDMVKHSMEEKLLELRDLIKRQLANIAQSQSVKDCFISYAWANSTSAVNAGSSRIEGALGWEDGEPRRIKQFLEDKGISCWIDLEQVGKEKSGLFADITAGVKLSRVFVACISKEYAKSENCMMELRYATLTQKKPVVFVVVGTGNDWKDTEVGLMRDRFRHFPKVNFQRPNPEGLQDLLKNVQEAMASNAASVLHNASAQQTPIASALDVKLSFNEEYELAQRKFLRLISTFAANMNTVPYPLVFVIDFVVHKQQYQTAVRSVYRRVSASSSASKGSDTLRKYTAMRTIGEMSTDDTWLDEELCVKLICEHEQGWHTSSSAVIPLTSLDHAAKRSLLINSAAYLHRMYKLLSHSTGVQLDFPSMDFADEYLAFIEKWALNQNTSSLSNGYCHLRNQVLVIDDRRAMGKLKRCHYPTGQIRWLCEEHSSASHVTVLSSDVTSVSRGQPLVTDMDIAMKKFIDNYSRSSASANIKRRVLDKMASSRDLPDGKKVQRTMSSVTETSASASGKVKTSRLAAAVAIANSGKLPPASNGGGGSGGSGEKTKSVKQKVQTAALVARTGNAWSNKPAATSQACCLL